MAQRLFKDGYGSAAREAGELDWPTPRLSPDARFALHSVTSKEDCIVHLTEQAGRLHVGSIVWIDLPVVGVRTAQVQWIRSRQAGCRLLVPLTGCELRASLTDASQTRPDFADLARHMAMQTAACPSAGQGRIEVLRIPKDATSTPARRTNRSSLPPLMNLATLVATGFLLSAFAL